MNYHHTMKLNLIENEKSFTKENYGKIEESDKSKILGSIIDIIA